jgi:hypothetical protein
MELAGPPLAGLLLAGVGLFLLLVQAFFASPSPAGTRRSRGILLSVSIVDHQKGSATVRYTAGRETYTGSCPVALADRFFPGQQVLVAYAADDPQKILALYSVSAALGKQFLGLLAAALLLIGGLLLIRLA